MSPLPPLPHIQNGTYTVRNRKTDEHRTFDVRTQSETSNFAPGKRVVALLTGPDNESNYTGFGFLTDFGIQVWKKRQGQPGNPSQWERLASLLWEMITKNHPDSPRHQIYEMLHEGRCIRCNRKLTDPLSIKTGIGPECAEIMGIDRDAKHQEVPPPSHASQGKLFAC